MYSLYLHACCFLVAIWLLYLQASHPHSSQVECRRGKIKHIFLFIRIEKNFPEFFIAYFLLGLIGQNGVLWLPTKKVGCWGIGLSWWCRTITIHHRRLNQVVLARKKGNGFGRQIMVLLQSQSLLILVQRQLSDCPTSLSTGLAPVLKPFKSAVTAASKLTLPIPLWPLPSILPQLTDLYFWNASPITAPHG